MDTKTREPWSKVDLLILAFMLFSFPMAMGLLEIEHGQITIGVTIIFLGICSIIVLLILNHRGILWKLNKEGQIKS